jgi:hypothetical protein
MTTFILMLLYKFNLVYDFYVKHFIGTQYITCQSKRNIDVKKMIISIISLQLSLFFGQKYW